ncbi:hypothetical protein E4U55_005802 [Claviceps digitariae]|nr:hypothetical protein E4U55_005802 [Claviceps digitariae]
MPEEDVAKLRSLLEQLTREKQELTREKQESDERAERLAHEKQESDERSKRLAREKQESDERSKRLAREKQELDERSERFAREYQQATFEEFHWNCHVHVYTKLRLGSESNCTTGLTWVDGRFYPRRIQPWSTSERNSHYQHFEVARLACGDKRLFPSKAFSQTSGENISLREATTEKAVVLFEKVATEDAILRIFKYLQTLPEIRAKYGFDDIQLVDKLNTSTYAGVSQLANEEKGREQEPSLQERTGRSKRVASDDPIQPRGMYPDGLVYRVQSNRQRTVTCVYEHKAAHKLLPKDVKSALSKETLLTDVVQQLNSNSSKQGAEKEIFLAELGIAMALTQVFHYMISFGVTYGFIAAGKTLLLLRIRRDDPQTLYCHPCVPSEDVGDIREGAPGTHIQHTAVAELLSFLLSSLESNENESATLQAQALEKFLENANQVLRKWPEPYEDAAHSLSQEVMESMSSSSSSSPPSTPGKSEFKSKAAPTGRVIPSRGKSSCKPPHQDLNETDESDAESNEPPSTSRTSQRIIKRKGSPLNRSSEKKVSTQSSASKGQYCTQACLLGLKMGMVLDDKCPNVSLHRAAAKSDTSHPLTITEFCCHVSERLRKDPYRDCYSLQSWGKEGAVGVLFKIELNPYGYIFVGKGTRSHYLPILEKECRVYKRLEALQGWQIPVHLGLIHLDRGYMLPGGIRAVHMMLMSWVGERAVDEGLDEAELKEWQQRTSEAIKNAGIFHDDERPANILWSRERGCPMFVDFSHSRFRAPPEHQQLSNIKKAAKRNRKLFRENKSHKRVQITGIEATGHQ